MIFQGEAVEGRTSTPGLRDRCRSTTRVNACAAARSSGSVHISPTRWMNGKDQPASPPPTSPPIRPDPASSGNKSRARRESQTSSARPQKCGQEHHRLAAGPDVEQGGREAASVREHEGGGDAARDRHVLVEPRRPDALEPARHAALDPDETHGGDGNAEVRVRQCESAPNSARNRASRSTFAMVYAQKSTATSAAMSSSRCPSSGSRPRLRATPSKGRARINDMKRPLVCGHVPCPASGATPRRVSLQGSPCDGSRTALIPEGRAAAVRSRG